MKVNMIMLLNIECMSYTCDAYLLYICMHTWKLILDVWYIIYYTYAYVR